MLASFQFPVRYDMKNASYVLVDKLFQPFLPLFYEFLVEQAFVAPEWQLATPRLARQRGYNNLQQSQQHGAKTIKKNTNSTQNKSQTHRAKQYEVTSFLSTDCELSIETCSKNVYSLGPWSHIPFILHY